MSTELEKLKVENEKLKKINSVKSDLISISAHELRTSLSALRWILKMFTDKDLGKITSEQELFIERAVESSDRMIDLVNNLLTFNHSEDLEIPFDFKPLDIINIIEQTIFEFSGEAHKKDIELIFLKPNAKLPNINADKKMIRVVFQNLIENAIKYSDNDDKIFVSLKQNEKENTIEVSIRDTGIGIDDEDHNKIFHKFFRAQNAIKKDPLGSGLGLFTTQNIINHHKGKIWFESNSDIGTTFFVALPIF